MKQDDLDTARSFVRGAMYGLLIYFLVWLIYTGVTS